MHHQTGGWLTDKQCWEAPWHSTSGVPAGKRPKAACLLCGWDFKGCSLGFLLTIPRPQTIIISLRAKLQLWYYVNLFHVDYVGLGKDPGTGKDWRQEEKGATDDEMVGWHHRLNGHESEQTPGDSDGQGSLPRCSPRRHKQSDVTEWLNNKSCSVSNCI